MKKTSNILALLLLSIFFTLSSPFVFARGGGGGSGGGGGGGGGGGFGGGSHSSSPQYQHGSCTSSTQYQSEADCKRENLIGSIIVITISVVIGGFVVFTMLRQKFGLFIGTPENAEPVLSEKTKEVYFLFQKAWSEFDTDTLQKITSTRFYNQLVLELGVLKNEKRENRMDDVQLLRGYVDSTRFKSTEPITTFRAQVIGKARDTLFDTELEEELYTDTSVFTEYWTFVLENNEWKLDYIKQATEEYSSKRPEAEAFASKNNFFYNPDFGWLMIPNKGVLFSQSSFKTTDINNHVIGVYKNKIVEFYTIVFKQNTPVYFIGQAILPKSYNRILVRRKNKFSFFEGGVSGLRKIEMESVAFNDEFEVYSDHADTMTTFELLHPAFMEYIMGLPYTMSIEVVGNTVYFYTKTVTIDYDKLLEILSRAFDEIKV